MIFLAVSVESIIALINKGQMLSFLTRILPRYSRIQKR